LGRARKRRVEIFLKGKALSFCGIMPLNKEEII